MPGETSRIAIELGWNSELVLDWGVSGYLMSGVLVGYDVEWRYLVGCLGSKKWVKFR